MQSQGLLNPISILEVYLGEFQYSTYLVLDHWSVDVGESFCKDIHIATYVLMIGIY